MRRKLVIASAAMMLGIWLVSISVIIAACSFAAAFLFAAIYLRDHGDEDRKRKTFIVMILLFLVFGMLRSYEAHHIYSGFIKNESEAPVKVIAKVEDIATLEDHQKMVLKVLSIDGKRTSRSRILAYSFKNRYSSWKLTGQTITFSSPLSVPDGARNPRCFDYRTHLKSKGIYLTARCDRLKILPVKRGILGYIRCRIIKEREAFLGIFGGDSEARGMMRGILFGDTGEIDDDTYASFALNGTAHILAVSGLHIGIIYYAFLRIRKRLRRPAVSFLFWVLILIYGTMSMWSVSVLRAVVMIAVMELGSSSDRRYDILTSLGVVAMVSLTMQPFAMFGTSFQMSYLAVLSIAMILPVLKRHVPGPVAAPLSVQIGLSPYMAYVFDRVTPGAVLINVPVALMMSFIVPCGIVLMALRLFSDALAPAGAVLGPIMSLGADALSLMTRVLIFINSAFSGLPFVSFDTVSPPLFLLVMVQVLIIIFFSETFFILKARREKKGIYKLLAAAAVTSALALPFTGSAFDGCDIVMVDVGQGDALHVRAGVRTDIIIDGGGSERRNIGKDVLKPYFLKNGVRDIDLALVTHLHTDHFKGIKELAGCYPVKKAVLSGEAGDIIRIGDSVTISILWPEERDPDTEDENRNTLVFKVVVKGVSLLVTGDLGEEGERELLERYRGTDVLDSDILKVGHHGSRYSSSPEFLEAVSPEIALIGVGKNNTYGHPSEETLDRLKEAGAAVYRTDLNGAIGIDLDRRPVRIALIDDPMKDTA